MPSLQLLQMVEQLRVRLYFVQFHKLILNYFIGNPNIVILAHYLTLLRQKMQLFELFVQLLFVGSVA